MEINERVQELLNEARQRAEFLAAEKNKTEAFVAALELAVEQGLTESALVVPPLYSSGETPRFSLEPEKPARKKRSPRHGKRGNGRGPRAPVGEMRRLVLAAFAHHDGQPLTCQRIVRYCETNKPPSLKGKHGIDHASWVRRVNGELTRMRVQGMVSGERVPSMGFMWSLVGRKKKAA